MPPVTQALLIANVIVFLAQMGSGLPLVEWFALWPGQHFMPWQLVTYSFLHGGMTHILFNMLGLYMFGADVTSQWREGSPIVWKGEFKGKAYEDKGTILRIEPETLLQYSHFSPLSGKPDQPESYHTVTIELSGAGDRTHVVLTQDNNPTEQAREHSEKNWRTMLEGLKKYVER